MYDNSDPRARLSNSSSAAPALQAFQPADCTRFYEAAPQIVEPARQTWLARGQNAVISYSTLQPGGSISRRDQKDEWALLIPERNTRARISASNCGEASEIAGHSLTFLPPGASDVSFPAGGRAVCIFTTASDDLTALCPNDALYAQSLRTVPPYAPWPRPAMGDRIRSYSLDVPDEPGRFGRIWRCTTLMINCLTPQMGPRDPTKLSPHHHDDFEQYSLALNGSFLHHLRWPWVPNMKMWRPDEHEFCGSPSVAVIPPPVIHTTQAVDSGPNLLVDIFAPPRMDFSVMPGWVLNNDDYPMPG